MGDVFGEVTQSCTEFKIHIINILTSVNLRDFFVNLCATSQKS